uniref:Uncharacterized protein n=1 Tax=Romanomermis culicivorax TaxID=13658 RepID=A0A915KNS5_ROMCU
MQIDELDDQQDSIFLSGMILEVIKKKSEEQVMIDCFSRSCVRSMESKITLTWVNALHSTYLTAFNSRANFSPCSNVIGFCLFLANFSTILGSSRKSTCVPTNKNGVFAQWCVISGTH